jgi:hypothetical protein
MRALLTLTLLGCGILSRLEAQWHLGADLAHARYGGSAHDTSASQVDTHPDGGVMASLRVGRTWSRWGTSLRISYANPGFRLGSNGLTIVDKTTGRLFEVSPLVSTRVGGIGPSGAVRVEVGPALHLWDFDNESRARVGAVGAAVYEWPVSRRFTGAIRFEGSLSPSWFNAADVPPEFERRVTWRYGVGLGLRYRVSGG